jgi:rhodanese-related sulfurtransferase
MFKDISGAEMRELIQGNENAVLIDVRTPEECAAGIIPGAKNIDLMGADFMEQVSKLDKDKEYFMICRSGGRSATACGAMAQNGFKNLYNLNGGMMFWDGDVQ